MSEDARLVRVNTRISVDLNDWLDKHSAETALSKSTIIMLATENYRQQKEVVKGMSDMSAIMEKLDDLEKRLPDED